MAKSHSQNFGFGRPVKDLGVSTINVDHLTSNIISSIEHIDTNIVGIEKDIFDLQDIAYHNAEESINTLQEISTVQNDLLELQYVQSLPWFCKSSFVYEEIKSRDWNNNSIPDSSNQLFIRYVDLTDTFTSMFLIFPRVSTIGGVRHATMFPQSSEACVYITSNPNDTIRLSSFSVEWFPPSVNSNNDDADQFFGFKTLLAKPAELGGYVFGSSAESKSQGQCVIFPGSGAFYVQSIYIDNNTGHSRIVFIGQKYQNTNQAQLGEFSFYGVQ
jgi:hypothetical protein